MSETVRRFKLTALLLGVLLSMVRPALAVAFQAASLSKFVAAIGAMRLVDQKRLALDKPSWSIRCAHPSSRQWTISC